MSLVVNQIVKTYGKQTAVNGISFSAGVGEIIGFLGPNGAGKSTTMKMATGFIPPDSGTIEVLGIPVQENPIAAQRHIGYLPEHNPLYLDAYVHEYLLFVAALQGVKRSGRGARVKEVVELCGLGPEQNKRIAALSKGYRQRVGLAQALVHDPDLLILDEPTTGLDPNQIVEIREVIRSIKAEKTVVFSTHIMQEVKALCDRVIIIHQGRLVADQPLQTLNQAGKLKILRLEFEHAFAAEKLSELTAAQQIEALSPSSYKVFSEDDRLLRQQVLKLAYENSWPLLRMGLEENSLEKTFRELTLNAAEV